MVDGLIIPRTYNDYFSRSDPAAIRQLVAQFTDAALSATSENPVQNKVVKAALDVINAVIPAGASASDKLALESSVDAIDAKIPMQASAQNQLADKDFVNSSISTNTANYISDNGDPFTSVAALEAYSGTVTNNDYAFVTGTDAAGNVYYDRYKATVSGSSVSWAKEYRLNNSSFTAAQWAAINSGITAAIVAQIQTALVPIGSVIACAVVDPNNAAWLECNGQSVPRADYPTLFNLFNTQTQNVDGVDKTLLEIYGYADSTHFNLPDYREVALVGAGQNATEGNNITTHDVYTVGQFKDDRLQDHQHKTCTQSGGGYGNDSWNYRNTEISGANPHGALYTYDTGYGGRIGDTTRGKRKGVKFLIKVL